MQTGCPIVRKSLEVLKERAKGSLKPKVLSCSVESLVPKLRLGTVRRETLFPACPNGRETEFPAIEVPKQSLGTRGQELCSKVKVSVPILLGTRILNGDCAASSVWPLLARCSARPFPPRSPAFPIVLAKSIQPANSSKVSWTALHQLPI